MNESFQAEYLRKIHGIFLWVFLAHIPACAAVAEYNHLPVMPVVGIGLGILGGPLLCWLLNPAGRTTSFACGIACMCFCGLLIHAGRGMIECHFLIFVELALLIVLRDWLVIAAAAATIAVHHTAFYFLLPASVFNYQASFSTVLFHATFVVLETIPACLIARFFGQSIRAQAALSAALEVIAAQVSMTSGQMSSASESLAQGASEQAAAQEETSSSLEEISSRTKTSSEKARQANELAKEARAAADKGAGDMQTMSAAMQDIKVSSDDIAKIIKTIDEIAFQTNILALNASVEAARAGEAGMGFAVVADEVGNLAHRCARAARETAGKIEGAIIKTGQGVEMSRKVAGTLNEITRKVLEVDELVADVAAAALEQTEGIAHINQSVREMDKVTQNNAAAAEQTAAAAGELNSQAEVLNESVSQLVRLVGGKRAAPATEADLPSLASKKVRAGTAPAKRGTPTDGKFNGRVNGGTARAATVSKRRRAELPMAGDRADI